jgi:murein DD-endopeptidase MepM/ murein hydrolase activator NlpD
MNHRLAFILRTFWLTSLLIGTTVTLLARQPQPQPVGLGVEESHFVHDEISPAQEQAMWEEIQRNLVLLKNAGLLPPTTTTSVTYNFPLRLAPGLPDYAGFRVSAFSDHNAASGQVLDYNGGTRTYDGHRGTDYALSPFGWNKLDAGAVEVIAAADGTILLKSNTDPTDHNCNVSSPDPWNYVALVHADGRLTIYGHMRYNSLTSKGIGETVTQGEYLGLVASSGNSSGPHLHFEARFGSYSSSEWIDPYAGPHSQPESLWTSQRPYVDSAVNKVATHSAPPSTPDPCQPTITNLEDSFITPRNIYFYTYYRDFQGTLPTQLKLYRPDGTIFQSSQYAPGNPFNSSWSYGWAVNFSNNEPAGTWRFEVTYNGQVYETFFNVNAPTTVAVSSPNGGEELPIQLPHTITWTDNLGGDVNIALYHNGVYTATLVSNTPSDGEYGWVPAAALAPGSGYTIRVTSVINPTTYDESNAPFTLIEPTSLIARDDFALTGINTPVTIDVLHNDEALNGDPLTITALGSPNNGSINTVGANLLYTPTIGFLGTDVFTYTVSTTVDQATATVTVLVTEEVSTLFLLLIWR